MQECLCNQKKIITLWCSQVRWSLLLWNIKAPWRVSGHYRTLVKIYMISLNWARSWKFQQNGMCVHRRPRSTCVSAQSDSSLPYSYEPSVNHMQSTKRTQKTLIRLCRWWVFTGHTCHFVWISMSWLNKINSVCFYIFVSFAKHSRNKNCLRLDSYIQYD